MTSCAKFALSVHRVDMASSCYGETSYEH